MTTIEQFHARIRSKVRELSPLLATAYLAGLRALLDLIDENRAMLNARQYEEFISLVLTDVNIATAFAAYRAALISALGDSMRYAARAIPNMAAADVSLMPNVLDANVLAAMRSLDAATMSRLDDEIRGMARAVFQQGGSAKEILATLKSSVGLGPTQVGDVTSFRLAQSEIIPALDAAKIERVAVIYSQKRIAANAATNARTAALMATKQGDALAWQYAQDSGLVPDGMTLQTTWRQVKRPTMRASHALMDGKTVPFGTPFPNGDVIVGEGDPWNCLCVGQVTVAVA